MPTIAVRSHGNRDWKWVLMDWGILIADGYERTKTRARDMARAKQKQIFEHQQPTR